MKCLTRDIATLKIFFDIYAYYLGIRRCNIQMCSPSLENIPANHPQIVGFRFVSWCVPKCTMKELKKKIWFLWKSQPRSIFISGVNFLRSSYVYDAWIKIEYCVFSCAISSFLVSYGRDTYNFICVSTLFSFIVSYRKCYLDKISDNTFKYWTLHLNRRLMLCKRWFMPDKLQNN